MYYGCGHVRLGPAGDDGSSVVASDLHIPMACLAAEVNILDVTRGRKESLEVRCHVLALR